MKIKHKTVTLLSHEFMHVLGFNHEQNRGDQAQNVRIHWENIDPALHFAGVLSMTACFLAMRFSKIRTS